MIRHYRSLQTLIVLSLLLLPSIFVDSKAAAVVLFLYVMNVAWCLFQIIGKDTPSILYFFRQLITSSDDHLENKRYLSTIVYLALAAAPFLILGTAMVFVIIGTLWLM